MNILGGYINVLDKVNIQFAEATSSGQEYRQI